jgi:Fe-S-cluster-containing dehydrogenase component
MDGAGGHSFYLPLLGQQCENAPCVNVCPVGATYHNAEGVVLINHERCIGCRMCMAACPYGVRSFNWDQPPNPPEATFANYSPEFPIPHRRGTVNKCMLCVHHLDHGKLPACAAGCPMFAIYLADLGRDVATNGREVVQFSRFVAENNAFQLLGELGTKPRVWYIPGHGEEYGHDINTHAPMVPARTWIEQRAAKEERDAQSGGGS